MDTGMSRTIIFGLRILYVLMMALFLIMILTDSISGYQTVVYTLLILAVIGAEQIMKRKVKNG